MKRILFAALASSLAACTQKVPSTLASLDCEKGQLLVGAGADQPLKCTDPLNLSVTSTQHAQSAGEALAALMADQVANASQADVALALEPDAGLVIGTISPAARVDVESVDPDGGIRIDQRSLVGAVAAFKQTQSVDTSGSNDAVLMPQKAFTVATPTGLWFEGSGSVNATNSNWGTNQSVCRIQFLVDGVSSAGMTLVTTHGGPSTWRLEGYLSASVVTPGTHTFQAMLTTMSSGGGQCLEHLSGDSYSTQAAFVRVEAFHED